MPENKETRKAKEKESKKNNLVKPGEIQGKIDVKDTRERKDGPGGN